VRPLWAVLRPLPWLPAPLREGRELSPAAGGRCFALCPAPCSASRRTGADACGVGGRASLSAQLPAPLREGRELSPAAGGRRFALCPGSLLRSAKDGSFRLRRRGQGFALCPAPCSAPRRAGACACGWWAALRSLPWLPAPLREGRELYLRRQASSSAVSSRYLPIGSSASS